MPRRRMAPLRRRRPKPTRLLLLALRLLAALEASAPKPLLLSHRLPERKLFPACILSERCPRQSKANLSNSAKNGQPGIVIKKEPGSPRLANSRHRPPMLHLSRANVPGGPATAIGLPGREGLGIQEVGLACLSPGFVTQDPVMKQQLERSMTVRDQQRDIIERRLQQQSAKGERHPETPGFAAKTPGMSRRKGVPPGLSIVAPSHEQFANELVIQSAPLGRSFTGRHYAEPNTRHIAPNRGGHSHIHPPPQHSANRLPPISDVFSHGTPAHAEAPSMYSGGRPMPSPGMPPGHPAPPPQQARYKSAEEAQQEIARGRPELLPKLVHYGGHQPPTPPSPRGAPAPNGSGRRRPRAEYEGSSPPLGHGPSATRRGPFGAGRDSPETQRQKKEEFLRLCDRAWDLFHS